MGVLMKSMHLLDWWRGGASEAYLCGIAIRCALSLMLFPPFWSLVGACLPLGLSRCCLNCLHIRGVVRVVSLLNSHIEVFRAISDRLEYS